MASPKQQKFLQDLFDELGFSRVARNGFLTRELKREISYLDELNGVEASAMIQALIDRKEDRKVERPDEEI